LIPQTKTYLTSTNINKNNGRIDPMVLGLGSLGSKQKHADTHVKAAKSAKGTNKKSDKKSAAEREAQELLKQMEAKKSGDDCPFC